jgi:hypothetical protein
MSELPPPPGSGSPTSGPFTGWAQLPPPPIVDTQPPWPPDDRAATRYESPPPPASRSGVGCLIAVLVAAAVLIGLVGLIALISFASGEDETSSSPSGTAPPASIDPDLLEPPELEPLEHDLDVFGEVGTCVSGGTYATVPCDQSHDAEVFARIPVPGETYPGAEVLQDEHAAACEDEFTSVAGKTSVQAGLIVVGSQPSEAAWEGGQHEVVCIASSFSGDNTGSITELR